MKRTVWLLLIIASIVTAPWPVNGFCASGLVTKAGGLMTGTYGNGVMTSITPDVRNRPDNWVTTIGVDDLINNDFVYDPFGNITDIGSEHFVYDPLNRLTNAYGVSDRDFTYVYDANGNVQTVSKTGPSESSSFAYTNNHLNGVTYDADGNLTDDGVYTYDYDQLGQMTSSGSDSYTYDSLGKRIKKTSGMSSLAYCYLGEQLISTYDENLLSYYDEIYLEGQLLARVVDDGVSITDVTYAHLNHLGSPIAFTDDSGNVVWPGQSGGTPYEIHNYEPFGADFADLGSPIIEQDVRFTGKLFDTSTEKHYFNARYYNGITTDSSYEMPPRFLSPDVINGNPEGGQSWNRYRYCLNNPVNMVDPDGNYEVPVIWHPWDKFSDLPYDIFGIRSMIDISTSINGASAKSMQVSVKGSPAVSTVQKDLLIQAHYDIKTTTYTQLEFPFARGASVQTPGVTAAGERFVRVGAGPQNLKFTFETPGGVLPGTYAFPEATFKSIGNNPTALKNLGDLPGTAPQYYRILEPPVGTAIQRGIVPGGQYGGVGGVEEVIFPRGF